MKSEDKKATEDESAAARPRGRRFSRSLIVCLNPAPAGPAAPERGGTDCGLWQRCGVGPSGDGFRGGGGGWRAGWVGILEATRSRCS